MNKAVIKCMALFALGFATAATHATPSLGLTSGFDSDTDNFAGTNYVAHSGSGGNPGGYVQISFPGGGGIYETLVTNTTANYVGDYYGVSPELSVYFDFYASNALPDSSALYFHSTNGGGETWTLAFTQAQLGWQSHQIGFSYNFGPGWARVGGGGTASGFLSALSSIDWIGINVQNDASDNNAQIFGFDNWGYAIPEPGDYAFALVLLLAGYSMYRKKQGEESAPSASSGVPA